MRSATHRGRARLTLVAGMSAVTFSLPTAGLAQAPTRAEPDSATATLLEAIVVTADRSATPLGSTVGAVTRLGPDDLRRLPLGGLSEALGAVPGFSMVDRDGSALDPQPIVRGFYGGGEAEYVLVLLDGKPLNALQTGLMAWELLPPIEVAVVEVLRGGASSLYGDAAIGGVVNFISAGRSASGARVSLIAAGDGLLRGGARVSTEVAGRSLAVYATGLDSDGYRDHGQRRAASAGLSVGLVSSADRSLALTFRSTWRDVEQPGPLEATDLTTGRRASDTFYRFDAVDERVHSVDLDGSMAVGGDAVLAASVTSELRRTDDVRTLVLAPDFADTKARDLATARTGGMAQITVDETDRALPTRVVAGLEASTGSLDSEYSGVVAGPRGAYAASDGSRGGIDAGGEGLRRSAAAFAQLDVWPVSPFRITLGLRYDRLSDRFVDDDPSADPRFETTNAAFSPKVGATLRWIETARTVGNVYASVSRSFKSATPDQLSDQRSIPIPFPPFSATTSNPTLVPQRGLNLEAGAYQSLSVGRGSATASLSVYQMDMEDELDFDLATLRYVNIGESRHRGVETEIRWSGAGRVSGRVGYTLQAATSRVGATAGLSLRAIPRHSWSANATAALTPSFDAGFTVTRVSGAWLDVENTVPLPAFTRVDARLTHDLRWGSIYVEARNVLDARYSTTGFPDPSGSGALYYYPAAARTLGAGLGFGL